MVVFQVWPHMVKNNDPFQADHIAVNAQYEIAEKYNGKVDDYFIKFISLSEEDKIKITTIYPFIQENKFVFFS